MRSRTEAVLPDDRTGHTETLSPILTQDIEAQAAALLHAACERRLRLATAESCTGGLLAALLTDVEGAAHAFDRGIVAYSEDAKCELLHVARTTIDGCGAVSRDVAIAMADGMLKVADADVTLAITGFAGQGGPDDEPGLVHFGCARRGRPTAHREEHFGDIGRGEVRIACMRTAIDMLREAIE